MYVFQTTHTSDCAALVDAQGVPLTMVETVQVATASPLTNGLQAVDCKTEQLGIQVNGSSVTSESPPCCEEYVQTAAEIQPQQFHPKNEILLAQQQQEVVQEQQPIEQPQVQVMQEQETTALSQEHQYQQHQQQEEVLQTQEPVVVEYSEVPAYPVETLPPQPMHPHHVIPQSCGQTYVYPGQYMFGSPVVSVNGWFLSA